MKINMLGTGNAMATKCYNTCFVLSNEKGYILIDGGGGNRLFTRLEEAGIDIRDLSHVILTHAHLDHIMGIIWLVRYFAQNTLAGKIQHDLNIYGHNVVLEKLRAICKMLITPKQYSIIDEHIHLITVEDGDIHRIQDVNITFFDIHSTKEKQFGFTAEYDDKRLTCLGDEPYEASEAIYVKDADYLLSEAFCLYNEADIFRPYEKHHSTVKDAALIASENNIKNLILYHTEDSHISERKMLYTKEAELYFKGNIYVPDDLDTIEI